MQRLDIPVLVQISVAHLISHIYILAIPALLPLLPDALGVSFVELGVVVSLFNIMSAFLQAPMGFAVDRFGARRVLVSGIAVGTSSCFFLAFFPTYTGLIIAAGLLGAANAVYHPSDYAILSGSVKESVMGRAFSIHSFAGFAGSAVTPFLMTTIALYSGLPAAFGTLGVMGVLTLFMFAVSRPERADRQEEDGVPADRAAKKSAVSVFTVPILILAVLYTLLSLSTASLERFSASALIQGYGIALPLANTALTVYLTCSAIGVLSGGILADRTSRHGYVAATAFAVAAVLTAIVAACSLPPVLLIVMFALIGFLTGVIVPSRDMLVRAAAPRGGEGKAFGIVTTGFNVAGIIGPILCGYFLDHGLPSLVFWATVFFMILTVMLTWFQEQRAGRKKSEKS